MQGCVAAQAGGVQMPEPPIPPGSPWGQPWHPVLVDHAGPHRGTSPIGCSPSPGLALGADAHPPAGLGGSSGLMTLLPCQVHEGEHGPATGRDVATMAPRGFAQLPETSWAQG